LPARNVCRALFLDVDGMLPDIADNRTGLLLEDKVAAPALNYRNAPGAASRYHIG
jgi:trehalose-6-phosphatase